MSTPHNSAEKGDFAKTVLMPGDPLRAKYIADHFLKEAKLVNNVRGVQGYTGLYKDTPVSVMASGMGMPSIGIYSHELFHVYDVDNIIRVGSAGAITKKLKLRDVVLGQAACTDSNFAHQFGLGGVLAPVANYELLETAVNVARKSGANWVVGSLFSSDIFYNKAEDSLKWADYGVMAVEMESAALYWNALEAGKRALTICTVSDSIVTGEGLPADQRQTSFTQMMEIALDTAVAMAKK
jgi:purine-nucleoside phosphorylase